ncbi:MAG TPA: outer membrane protein assembly factor BamC [Ideonella sp.]|nr:outer membrane protein assembly factor BamC [Ideonella sp.]
MTKTLATTPVRAAVATLALAALGGCGALDSMMSGDKIDYRSTANKTAPLEVPPDLTALTRDGRYAPQGGSVSAAALQQGPRTLPVNATATVAVQQVGDIRVERVGDERWLVTSMTPEQLYPRVKQFWIERGFNIASEIPEAGVMETDWAENRAKLPQDVIRNTLGRVLDSLYDTGTRDKFRTRLERTATGTEIYISHRGLEEVYVGKDRDGSTAWTGRPSDPTLEVEFLTRLMVSLGTKEEAARTAVAGATPTDTGTPKARARTDQAGAALQVEDGLDRAWRRVGLALDRGGFTVEDRDRAQGLYFVRYVDAKQAAKDEPNFFSRLFGAKDDAASALNRYRISVKPEGTGTMVTVLNNQGQPDKGANAQKIVSLLVDELKM